MYLFYYKDDKKAKSFIFFCFSAVSIFKVPGVRLETEVRDIFNPGRRVRSSLLPTAKCWWTNSDQPPWKRHQPDETTRRVKKPCNLSLRLPANEATAGSVTLKALNLLLCKSDLISVLVDLNIKCSLQDVALNSSPVSIRWHSLAVQDLFMCFGWWSPLKVFMNNEWTFICFRTEAPCWPTDK